MMVGEKIVAVRKRQQIDASKKTMFIFVASAAFVVGVAAVVGMMLIQQILFHGKILGEQQRTEATLNHNLATIQQLKDNVRALEANSALNSVKHSEESSALQVVLDALPDVANGDSLGASLHKRFADSIDGLTLENLTVEPVNQDITQPDASDPAIQDGSVLYFTMEVRGTADKLKALLGKLEKSIRPIDVEKISIEAGEDGQMSMTLRGAAHYELSQKVELDTKVVRP